MEKIRKCDYCGASGKLSSSVGAYASESLHKNINKIFDCKEDPRFNGAYRSMGFTHFQYSALCGRCYLVMIRLIVRHIKRQRLFK